jgi:[ribosomal protein S18]-alanine N-acetyltransferase
MAIVVRDFRPDDAPAILKIQSAAPEMAQWQAWDYVALSRKPGGIVLTAEGTAPESGVVGFVAAQTLVDEGEIQNLAVRADYRRRGIARGLLEEMHRRLLAAGTVERLFLEVRVSNLPARNLYRSLGYEECGLRTRYYLNDGEDALVLARYLRSSADLGSTPKGRRFSPDGV